MFERFTELARQVVVFAQEEARSLKHNYIGTEHLLLGLLRADEGVAADVLESLDLTVERVRAQVVRIVGSGDELTAGQIPFTPRSKKVLELALREALSLGHNYIGTEHLLLALVHENEGVAVQILDDFDADSQKVRAEVLRRLRGPRIVSQAPRAVVVGEPRSARGVGGTWLDGLGPVLDRLGVEIRGALGRDPDAGDLLLALACMPDLPAGQALGEMDIDLDALWGTIERAREQANRAREQARRERQQRDAQIHQLRLDKEQAIEARDFDRAAQLRDEQRKLVEEQAHATSTTHRESEAIDEIRRRLGIPRAETPNERGE